MAAKPKTIPATPTATFIDVTPEQATKWLGTSKVNRGLRETRVTFFMNLIDEGRFVMTGEPIQFEGSLAAGDEVLVNGQHRLTAISRGQKPVRLLVVDGVDKGSQVYMDTGTRRAFYDVLAMERGVFNTRQLAGAVTFGYLLDQGRHKEQLTGGSTVPPNNGELLQWFDEHPQLEVALGWGQRVYREIGLNMSSTTIAWMRFNLISPDECTEFFNRLVDGEELERGHPVLALRKWALTRTKPKPRAPQQCATTIKAWNAFRSGESVVQLRWRAYADDFPEAI